MHIINKQCLSESFATRQNCLSALRYFLALLVILQHAYSLGGYGADPLRRQFSVSFGLIATDGFFAISGFLAVKSFLKSFSVKHYLWKRFLRIFPAFWACLFSTALILAPTIYFLEHKSFENLGLFNNPFLAYVRANFLLLIRRQQIEGIFTHNPVSGILNGSLWILFPLFLCYLSVPLLKSLRLLEDCRKMLFFIFLALVGVNIWGGLAFSYFTAAYPMSNVAQQLFLLQRFLTYFLGGILLYVYGDRLLTNNYVYVAIFLFFTVTIYFESYNYIGPIILPYVIIISSIKLPFVKYNKLFANYYSLYIYAFPIQQTIYFLYRNVANPLLFFIISIIAVLPFTWLSYLLVEKPVSRFINAKYFLPKTVIRQPI